jgi:hypothetical protein
MTRAIDARLILRLAAQVEDLLARVTELENSQRTDSATIARHAQALEVIRQVLSDDGEGKDAEGATLQ